MMSRRVKQYLSNLTIIQDEEKLRDMSHNCEPAQGSGRVIVLFASPLSPWYFLVPVTLRPFMFTRLLVKTEQLMVDELCSLWV